MNHPFSIEQIQEINRVINQDLQLGSYLFPQQEIWELEQNFNSPPLPILIPYQSQLILNQNLLQKVIERLARGYAELQQHIEQDPPLNREHLRGLIRLSHSELEPSEIQLSLVIQQIGQLIRDLGGLSQKEYSEEAEGNIVFYLHDLSQFCQNLQRNKVGREIQKKLEKKQADLNKYLRKVAEFSATRD